MNNAQPIRIVFAAVILTTIAPGLRAQAPKRKTTITQVDVSDFAANGQVTIYFKVKDEDGNPSPVAKDEVEVYEDGNRVQIVDMKGLGEFDTRTILVVDVSGSMSEEVDSGKTKLQAVQESCHAFLDSIRSNDNVGLVQFSGSVQVVRSLGASRDDLKNAVDGLVSDGTTVWMDALYEALTLLENEKGRRTILFLSDGQDTGSSTPIATVLEKAKQLQVPIHTVGFGRAESIDEDALQEVASVTGGQCLIGPEPSELAQLYRETGSSAKEEMSVTYQSQKTAPDGLRRSIELKVVGAADVQSGFRDPHALTILSNAGIFAAFAGLLAIAWIAPWVNDARIRQREEKARRLAFTAPAINRNAAKPDIQLTLNSNPSKVPVSQEPRIVSLRVDAAAKLPEGAEPSWHSMYVIVLLDLSASMEGERLKAARQALESLVSGLSDNDSFCLIGFSDDASLIVAPSRVGVLRSRIQQQIAHLRTAALTRLAPGLEMLKQQLPPESVEFKRKTCVLVVSDGKLEDAATSLRLREQMPSVHFSAFGIGYDYDHNVLATLCGDKSNVEHLPSAAEANDAFRRFLTLDGQMLTSQASVELDLRPMAQIDELHLLRNARPLDFSQSPISIDNLSHVNDVSLLAELAVKPTAPGRYQLGDIKLNYDLPGYELYNQSVTVPIEIDVTMDGRESVPNPHVMQGLRTIRTGKLAEAVEADVESGNVRQATIKLRRFTQILQSEGEQSKAEEMEKLAAKLEQGEEADRNVKDVRYVTQKLTRGTDEP